MLEANLTICGQLRRPNPEAGLDKLDLRNTLRPARRSLDTLDPTRRYAREIRSA
jgi:hypothetical protein